MKIEYDKKADALYIYLSNKKIARTIPVNENINIDVDRKEKIVGVEVLDVSFQISKETIQKSVKNGVQVFA